MYTDGRTDKSVSPQRLLMLNYEDYVKIIPILQDPPSETKVVASNLRFTCWNYYDYLQSQTRMMKVQSKEEYYSMLSKMTNGNIITLCDIANLYTKELGIKTVPKPKNDVPHPIDAAMNKILAQYYQQEGAFENWIEKTTVWFVADGNSFFGINQPNENFVLDFTTEGNTLTYVKP